MAGSTGARQGGRSGGAALVAGLLLAGLMIMALASGVFFVANSAEQEKLEVLAQDEHLKRIEAEKHEAEAEARAGAEHERMLAAEKARTDHEAAQIEAFHAEEEARGAKPQPQPVSPPGIKVGVRLIFVQDGTAIPGLVLAQQGDWIQVRTSEERLSWINFSRVDRYEVVK